MKNKRKPKMRRGRYTTRLLFFFVLILLGMTGLFRQESAPERFGPYAVERVIDGDTIVADVDGRSETIRLIGVDAPESVHPDRSRNTAEGKKAAEYVRSLLEDKRKIYIEYDVSERINLLGTEKIIKTWKGGNSHVKYEKNRTDSPLRAFKSR